MAVNTRVRAKVDYTCRPLKIYGSRYESDINVHRTKKKRQRSISPFSIHSMQRARTRHKSDATATLKRFASILWAIDRCLLFQINKH